MTPDDLAQATAAAKIGVLWALLVAAVIVIVFLAMRLVQTREQMRKARGHVAAAMAQAAADRNAIDGVRAEAALEKANADAERKEQRRHKAIRVKTERRLTEQNATLERVRSERDDARADRDWLKKIVDQVET